MAWDVDAVVAPFSYAPPLDHYLHALKYRGARSLGRAFALLLAPALHERRRGVDALVAVPLHRARLARARLQPGARDRAHAGPRRSACRRSSAASRGARRRRRRRGQGARERRAGVARAFRVERDLRGRQIAIVDDVVTTGATVNALAAELKAAGAARCVVFAVARTPRARSGPGTCSRAGCRRRRAPPSQALFRNARNDCTMSRSLIEVAPGTRRTARPPPSRRSTTGPSPRCGRRARGSRAAAPAGPR